MESIRIPYKNDKFGNAIEARVSWHSAGQKTLKPIALVYHGGGLIVGSSEIIPKPQIEYLCAHGFVVVVPNYRLAPQVTAIQTIADCEEAYEWAITTLPGTMAEAHEVNVDPSRVVAYGHSTGGTLAIHLGSTKQLKAVTAFYPSLFLSDVSTSAHVPTTIPPFGTVPDFVPSKEDWAFISPDGVQLSEAPLGRPGTAPPPRNWWQMHLLKHGQWLPTLQPDGNYEVLDPMTRVSAQWPPVMIVQGEADNVPGSDLKLALRAEKEMKAAGVKEVQLEIVSSEGHMFDLPPNVGTTDQGPKWQAVVKGLDWLCSHT